MSVNRHYTLEQLQVRQEKAAQRQALLVESVKRAAARERALKKRITKQAAEEEARRLRTRGTLLERFIENAAQLTDAQIESMLTTTFGHGPLLIAANEDTEEVVDHE